MLVYMVAQCSLLLLFGLRHEVYHSNLRGVSRPDFCASHGRQVVLPEELFNLRFS